ncbi:MAG: helix-turn-helix transcriptional regulator [Deltaproteobacteria bacterium]|nr:helix-turn-helix transcriptional regulator [Deltaproteobacteria bacterium]
MKSRLKQIMSEKGKTVRDLVKETGISSATITKARNGRISSCSFQSLEKIAKYLDVPVSALFDEE